jgi:hypothetical protein
VTGLYFARLAFLAALIVWVGVVAWLAVSDDVGDLRDLRGPGKRMR